MIPSLIEQVQREQELYGKPVAPSGKKKVSEARIQDFSVGEGHGYDEFSIALPDDVLDMMECDHCSAEERWDQAHPQEVREGWAEPDLNLDPIDQGEDYDALENC